MPIGVGPTVIDDDDWLIDDDNDDDDDDDDDDDACVSSSKIPLGTGLIEPTQLHNSWCLLPC